MPRPQYYRALPHPPRLFALPWGALLRGDRVTAFGAAGRPTGARQAPFCWLRQGNASRPPFYCPARVPFPCLRQVKGLPGAIALPRAEQRLTAAILVPQAGHVPPGRHWPASDRAASHSGHFTTSGKGNCLWGIIAQPRAR